MSTENLDRTAAIKKMKKLVEEIKVSMMITGFDKKPLSAIPMTTKRVDDDGTIWFLSLRSSVHNKNLLKEKDIQLLYSDPSDMEFLSIYGEASITSERKILEALYSKMDDTWFDGVEDPDLTALRIKPEEAFYWDTKSNKYLTLLKLGMGAVTGKKKDIGNKGSLNL